MQSRNSARRVALRENTNVSQTAFFRFFRNSETTMNTNVERDATKALPIQKALSLLTVAIGIALLAYMVSVEGEPGAVPLLLVTVGTVWYLVVRHRDRRVSHADSKLQISLPPKRSLRQGLNLPRRQEGSNPIVKTRQSRWQYRNDASKRYLTGAADPAAAANTVAGHIRKTQQMRKPMAVEPRAIKAFPYQDVSWRYR